MPFIFVLCAIILPFNFKPIEAQRSLLLFGNKEEPLMKQQWQLLNKDSTGLAEREVHIKMIGLGNGLYKQYDIDVNTSFTVILIGKDGGEKYRSARPITSTQLFALIDAMPMRRSEMQKQKKNNK
jgi:Domain of unknown function (DUF4174)